MKKIATLAIVSGILMLASAVQAEIVTPVVTDADADVNWNWGSSANTNYGGGATVYVQKTNTRKGYFDFDLSGLDDSKAVTAAELRITQKQITVYGTRLLKVFAIMDEAKDWNLPTLGELAITWNNALHDATPAGPQNDGGSDFYEEGTGVSAVTRWLADQTLSADAGDHMYTIDVTGLIKWALGQDAAYSDYAQSDDHLSILLRDDTGEYVRFYSKEGDIDKAARLVITQVPEPATMGLLGLGFAGMAAMRRRRRK